MSTANTKSYYRSGEGPIQENLTSSLTVNNQEEYKQARKTVPNKAQSAKNQVLQNSIQILPNKLYFYCNRFPPKNVSDSFFFNIDEILAYQGYNKDFGPLNLAQVHRFCTELNRILGDEKYRDVKIFHHCSPHYYKQSNACFLMAAFLVICCKMLAEDAWEVFTPIHNQIIPFRDAGEQPTAYECTALDCLRGLQKAVELGWYNFNKFDHREYEANHKLENGDMNWIIPNKIIAFSSPTDKPKDGLPAQFFIPKFKKMGITGVVRLNEPLYDANVLRGDGIKVYDLEFLDGSCPADDIISSFLGMCEVELNQGGAIAVHCRAGLGRTGTLIACYIMKRYKFEARSLLGWLRIARPGMVIGQQQEFLNEVQSRLKFINSQKLDKNEGMTSKKSSTQLNKLGERIGGNSKASDNKQVTGMSREFGSSVLANNMYNIEMGGGGSVDHRISQGEQLIGKRKKLTHYIQSIDKMLSKNSNKQ